MPRACAESADVSRRIRLLFATAFVLHWAMPATRTLACKYFKGTAEPTPPPLPLTAWAQPVFQDATWLDGVLGVGYGDTDLADYLVLAECFAGPGVPVPAGGRGRPVCTPADLDEDGDIDGADLLAFQAGFTGSR